MNFCRRKNSAMSRPLTPRLVHVQPVLEIARDSDPHYETCWRCRYKDLMWWTIDSVRMVALLLAFSVPLVVLLAMTACCGTRKKRSQLEDDLDSMIAMSPKALATRMPKAPTSTPSYSSSPIATRTRIRRRIRIAS